MSMGMRALKVLWASPNTMLGLSIGVVLFPFGARMRANDGIIEIDGPPVAYFLRRVPIWGGALALTLGHVILARSREDQVPCRRHELVHVRQYEIWGPLFLPAYLIASLRARLSGGRAYRDNVFEDEAYTREREA